MTKKKKVNHAPPIRKPRRKSYQFNGENYNEAIRAARNYKRSDLDSIIGNESVEDEPVNTEEDEIVDDDYLANSLTEDISFVEFAIMNDFLNDAYRGKYEDISINSYGHTDGIGRVMFGGAFDITSGHWYGGTFSDDDNEYIFQTLTYTSNGDLYTKLQITSKVGISTLTFEDLFIKLKNLAFNNSKYNGKCITVKLRDGRFRGIEIVDVKEASNPLILNEVQRKYVEHFIKRVKRGGSVRYLFNGVPGTGKTESIREIARRLIPDVTFIIPEFSTADDLTLILEACEIFNSATVIMDDIDLYLGSRDNGSYTRLLGQFLSFFDGVKKRKISLLASTNDKGLVDKAAERPGRFQVTLDFDYLDDDQVIDVCKIHLPKKWQKKKVYEVLTGSINGESVNITGAFIANLSDNLIEMSEDDDDWNMEDTLSLIKETYRGFYMSQIGRNDKGLGFQLND